MRRPTMKVLPALLASVLFLAACGGSDAESETGSQPEDSGTSDSGSQEDPGAESAAGTGVLPEVRGDFGAEPEIIYPDDDPSPALEVEVLSEGEGAEVAAGDLLVADYIGQVWDGETFDNSFIRDEPTSFPIGVSAVIAGWDQGLVGQSVGSRVLLSIPSELGYAEGNPGAGIEVGDTIVFVVDIVDAYGPGQAGDADATVDAEAMEDLPIEITGELGEPVTVTIKDDATEPSDVRVTVLAEGQGEPVEEGTTALHFAAAFWGEQEPTSTWEGGQVASVPVGASSSEFDELVGVPVGSRVMIEIPAAEGAVAAIALVDIIGQPRR